MKKYLMKLLVINAMILPFLIEIYVLIKLAPKIAVLLGLKTSGVVILAILYAILKPIARVIIND